MEDMGFVEAKKVLFGIYNIHTVWDCTALPGEITVMVSGKQPESGKSGSGLLPLTPHLALNVNTQQQ
jgi:hypothetical protein